MAVDVRKGSGHVTSTITFGDYNRGVQVDVSNASIKNNDLLL